MSVPSTSTHLTPEHEAELRFKCLMLTNGGESGFTLSTDADVIARAAAFADFVLHGRVPALLGDRTDG